MLMLPIWDYTGLKNYLYLKTQTKLFPRSLFLTRMSHTYCVTTALCKNIHCCHDHSLWMWQSVSPVLIFRGESCPLLNPWGQHKCWNESMKWRSLLHLREMWKLTSLRFLDLIWPCHQLGLQSPPGLPKPDSGREWAKQVVFVTCVLNFSRQWFQDLRLKFTLSSTPTGNSGLPSTNPRNKMPGIPEGHLWYREEKSLWLTIFWVLGTSHILHHVVFIIALQEM